MSNKQNTWKAKVLTVFVTTTRGRSRRGPWKVWIIFRFLCKFVGGMLVFANKRIFTANTTQLRRRTNEQMNGRTCLNRVRILCWSRGYVLYRICQTSSRRGKGLDKMNTSVNLWWWVQRSRKPQWCPF